MLIHDVKWCSFKLMTKQFEYDDCFHYYSWRNNVVVVFRALSSFCSLLRIVIEVVCFCCPFAGDEKPENIHVDLASLVWGPTLLSTHACLPPLIPFPSSCFFLSLCFPSSLFSFLHSSSDFLPLFVFDFSLVFVFFVSCFVFCCTFCVCIFVCVCVRIWPLFPWIWDALEIWCHGRKWYTYMIMIRRFWYDIHLEYATVIKIMLVSSSYDSPQEYVEYDMIIQICPQWCAYSASNILKFV